jgi:hypothetical protein
MNREDAKARGEPFRSNEGLCPDSYRKESGKVEKLRGGKLVAGCPNVPFGRADYHQTIEKHKTTQTNNIYFVF